MSTFARLAVAIAVAAGMLATPGLAADLVPYKGTDRGTFEVVGLNGAVATTSDVAFGHGTHIGAYKLVAQEDLNLVTLAVTNGSWTLIAANGDTITGTYEGQAAFTGPDSFEYDVSGPITGGTGRFEGVTGTLTWHGAGRFTSATGGELTDVVTGRISTVGSVKGGNS